MRPEPRRGASALLLAALLAGCASLPAPHPAAVAPPSGKEAAVAAPPAPAREPDARELLLRSLAALLLRPEGAAPDFPEALKQVEAYFAQHPADREDPGLLSLALALREVARLDGELAAAGARVSAQVATILALQQQVERLAAENAGNKAARERLERENRDLKVVVERLRTLETTMEEKRKKVR